MRGKTHVIHRIVPPNGRAAAEMMSCNKAMRFFPRHWQWFAILGALWIPTLVAQAPAHPAQTPPVQQNPKPADSNPFPEDTTSVPVIPNTNAPAAPSQPADTAAPPALPSDETDPVRSPDEPLPDTSGGSSESSSSLTGLDRALQPPPDTESDSHGRNKRGAAPAPEHHETAAEDENVGNYYLGEHNWKAALSRFESAVVLDPENPEVYWGLAEAQRHLGDLVNAKANYAKCALYDPDSKHGKESKKMLQSPELANARAAAPATPAH